VDNPEGEGFGGVFGEDDVTGEEGAEGIERTGIGVLE
jgi:hypothetical protein